MFGVNSSPFLLNAVLLYHIEGYQEQDPEFVKKVSREFYVDDWSSGAEDVTEALNLYHKVKYRMLQGGFNLRKFKTSDPDLTNLIQKEEDTQKVSDEYNECDLTYAKTVLNGMSSNENPKVLGIAWDQVNDNLKFDLTKVDILSNDGKVTKRAIPSTLAKLFDLLGIISPVLISAKILFQELCTENLSWNDELPSDKGDKWFQWVNELQEVGQIT